MFSTTFVSHCYTSFPGEGNGNPLQYSCLENPMDGGAWCPLGCKQSDTTERLHFHFTLLYQLLTIDMVQKNIFSTSSKNHILTSLWRTLSGTALVADSSQLGSFWNFIFINGQTLDYSNSWKETALSINSKPELIQKALIFGSGDHYITFCESSLFIHPVLQLLTFPGHILNEH